MSKVSIITPVYNAEKFVSQTIDSVINQTYTDWEMIIIDDGSSDNSYNVIEKYTKIDDRIKLIKQKNAGCGAARNNGLKNATGRYIALLDADDTWNPDFLEKQLNLMQKYNCKLVYSSHTRIDENNKEVLKPFIVPDKLTYKDLLKSCSISCLTGLYDTIPYGKIYLKEDMKNLRDDYVYWLEIIKKVGTAYGNKEVLANYRIISTQATANKKKMIIPQFNVYFKTEKLGLLSSLYYTFTWAIFGLKKYDKIF